MAKLILDNITLDQAKALAHWYEGQGEQDAHHWLSEDGLEAPSVNVRNRNWLQINTETDTVTVDCAPH